jgi:methionyl-tRNA formyltransferase
MIRRAAFLLPSYHHHAPYVLDRVLAARPDLEALVVTTPKLATGRRSALSGLRATRSLSGVVYLGVMGAMSAGVAVASAAERLRDRPRGIRKYLSMTQVLAGHPNARHLPSITVNAPETLEMLRAFQPEVLLTVFFNQILSPEALAVAPRGWTLHPSLLPSFRGVSPVFWALAEGVPESGATLHRLTPEVDEGEILRQARIKVEDVESYFSLYRKCAERGAELIREALEDPDSAPVPPDPAIPPSRFSYPTAVAVRRFHRRGRRFFRIW